MNTVPEVFVTKNRHGYGVQGLSHSLEVLSPLCLRWYKMVSFKSGRILNHEIDCFDASLACLTQSKIFNFQFSNNSFLQIGDIQSYYIFHKAGEQCQANHNSLR